MELVKSAPADQIDPSVMITLRGQPYKMEFNNFAVKGLQADTGIDFLNTALKQADLHNPKVLGSLLYWGLKTHQPEMTQELVDKLLIYREVKQYMASLMQALSLFLPERQEGASAPDPQQPPAPSLG